MQVVLTFFTQTTGWHKPLPDLDSPQTLVLVFGEPDGKPYQHTLDELRRKYPTSVIVGCSTVAGIFNEKVLENALVVGVIRFKTSRVSLAIAELRDQSDSQRAGHQIAETLNAPDLKGILILTDGLNTHGTELLRGMSTYINPQQVNVVGGLASDAMQFKSTWVLCDGVPASHRVCGIGFYGKNMVFAGQAKDGFKPFGPERLITRADDRTLYEIDHRPALELYKEYLGEHANDLPASALHYPLAIWQDDKRHYAVRVPVAVNEADNSLSFVADIPTGYRTQFMYGNTDDLVDSAEAAARNLIRHLPPNTPILALTISCAVRKLTMGDDTDQELETVLDTLPPGSQQFGFYTFGELAPTEQGGACAHQNATMTLTVLYEGS
ncbi:MAG: FIST N-terminal domain-containing protein [Thiothrix sp.]|uniref:FIST signal transduction protein n=1 Tax=Thiothrix sp. TaxID=1032 RepID=UPI00260DD031|nr:FIST N-terminal domain-containing protein [Thiothrix sp.]MDD5394476.1 FIST N-terminal domain-containing protein [Thiothrix sp.]